MEINTEIDDEIKQLSEWELKDIVINRNRGGLTITAARKELEKRGISLTSEEILQQETVKNKRIEDAKKNISGLKQFWNSHREYIVTDETAPQLYTKDIIRVFSGLFSILFGGILLSMNLYRLNKLKYIWIVLLYSICFTGIVIYIKAYIWTTVSPYLLNIACYFPMEFLFWNEFIGKTNHRKRDFLIPLIIGVLLTALIIYLITWQRNNYMP